MARLQHVLFVLALIGISAGSSVADESPRRDTPRIGFLSIADSPEAMGPHNRAAWEAAKKLGQATLLLPHSGSGTSEPSTFRNREGNLVSLDSFDVLWYHQGDAIRRTAMYRAPLLTAVRRFAETGHGVLLSGGALAMVAQLRLETEIRPQRHDLGNYREPAGLVPVETGHPVFEGLSCNRDRIVRLSEGGCRAVADFNWGGPAEGMLLARTPKGNKNPLVEYSLGKGHVIVFGGRCPDFADRDNPHRENLLRLTRNLLVYLATPTRWRPIICRSDFPPAADADIPGISRRRWRALRMAIEDLADSFPRRYPRAEEFLRQLTDLRQQHDSLGPTADFSKIHNRFTRLQRTALLANPLLDFEHLLAIRRSEEQLGLLMNAHGNAELPVSGYENQLVSFSWKDPDAQAETIHQPPPGRYLGQVDLHFDARRLLFSMRDSSGCWRLHELDLPSGRVRNLRLIDEPDVHNYDGCYLPDDRIVFTSTAPFTGVPCLGGKSQVANLYLRQGDGSIRRLTHDQDHNWNPTLLNDGRLLYQRWEYADIAHAFTRLLFHANPDGSAQMEHYGSNSFWPTAMFFPKAVPHHPTKFVAVVGGHHDVPRQGELILFDNARGRHEASGVVQRIPGHGKPVAPKILDGLVGDSWPRFLHPHPLSEKHFLVSCKPTRTSPWGIYLVDVYDNFVLLREEPGWALLEPIPLRPTPRPPVHPPRVDPESREATVLLMDVYRGPGTSGVPRGSIHALRLISYGFTYHQIGGEPDRVGFDGPWDVKRIVGTVPVEPDGSAHFTVPAGMPIALQPLDAEGKAVALMRSWFTAAPGEILSCVGCHESQNTAPPIDCIPNAMLREPSSIEPWYGPMRGFSFRREVQPVLDKYCTRCHNHNVESPNHALPDFSDTRLQRVPSAFNMRFPVSYTELYKYAYSPTLESDAHLLPAYAYHADASLIVQLLQQGHYGVRLDREGWDRLITWIDLNTPAHGTWGEVAGENSSKQEAVAYGSRRRREMNRRYAGLDHDPEAVFPITYPTDPAPLPPREAIEAERFRAESRPKERNKPAPPNLPLEKLPRRTVELATGVSLEMVRIPPGRFLMGSEAGYPNERPPREVVIDKPFWMSRCEITNRQFACFDPSHDSKLETGEQYAFGEYERGHRLDRPRQPVVRVSWERAVAFCRWLSERTGKPFRLPSEAQWEYAARAGTTSPLWYGGIDDDFSPYANLSDATHHTVDYPHVPTALPPWRPAEIRFNDHWRVSAPVGVFAPNRWGLFDMHGNVAEWTSSEYEDSIHIPKCTSFDVIDLPSLDRKVVRGGSWVNRPRRARSAFRQPYAAAQPIHDVGFRIICRESP